MPPPQEGKGCLPALPCNTGSVSLRRHQLWGVNAPVSPCHRFLLPLLLAAQRCGVGSRQEVHFQSLKEIGLLLGIKDKQGSAATSCLISREMFPRGRRATQGAREGHMPWEPDPCLRKLSVHRCVTPVPLGFVSYEKARDQNEIMGVLFTPYWVGIGWEALHSSALLKIRLLCPPGIASRCPCRISPPQCQPTVLFLWGQPGAVPAPHTVPLLQTPGLCRLPHGPPPASSHPTTTLLVFVFLFLPASALLQDMNLSLREIKIWIKICLYCSLSKIRLKGRIFRGAQEI